MTKLNYRCFPVGQRTFDDLPESQIEIIETLVKDSLESSCRDAHSCNVDRLEYKRRDGFSPYSHNKGGVNATCFTDILGLMSNGGYNKELQPQIDKAIEYMTECFLEDNKEELSKHGITEASQIRYHDLNNIDEELASKFGDYEAESLTDNYNSVMYEIRAMYHGMERGVHSMTVFVSVSASDAPYHRNSDALGEQLITWKSDNGLKTKLSKALKTLTKKVF